MALSFPADEFSDEDVFFGKLSLKEVKKHILWNNHSRNAKNRHDDGGIKIIETHSAPDLNKIESNSTVKKVVSNTDLSPETPLLYPNWDIKPADDSFLKAEKMVADLCDTPENKTKSNQLDNTLDIIDYILNNGPGKDVKSQLIKNEEDNVMEQINPIIVLNEVKTEEKPEDGHSSPLTKNYLAALPKSPKYFTPVKSELNCKKTKDDKFITPSPNVKQKALFKTPAPLSQKKPSSTLIKRTPGKVNTYQHIASPVASYIKNCPVTPLVKEVRPTKPLPGTSSIPKFVQKPPLIKTNSKENVGLPSVAYRSAKKTRVIDVPDEEKLPQTQWMKKITSSLPKPVILKHNHREMNLAKRIISSQSQQENSFADLSLRQADVSVCTQKSAFNKPKKPL